MAHNGLHVRKPRTDPSRTDAHPIDDSDPFASTLPVPDGPPSITLTDNALHRLEAIRAQRKQHTLTLRVSVTGGGCLGFQSNIFLDTTTATDHCFHYPNGITVVVDCNILPLVHDSSIDFVDNLGGSYFVLHNANARSYCGCKTSFAL